jgi:hypothetical protein
MRRKSHSIDKLLTVFQVVTVQTQRINLSSDNAGNSFRNDRVRRLQELEGRFRAFSRFPQLSRQADIHSPILYPIAKLASILLYPPI